MKRAVAALFVVVSIGLALAPPAGAYTHFSASDNVTLSIRWSQALFAADSAASAIVARSDGFADSLAAGALAGSTGAPVLLNPSGGGLDDRLVAELDRLGTETVHVIGGTAAVSAQAVADLEAAGHDVQRHAGINRLATAADVLQDAYDAPSVVHLARGFGTGSSAFADSLGAGMLAGTRGSPLLLTATASLSPETRDALAGASTVETVVIVGGTAAVSRTAQDQVAAMGFDVERIAGTDRFETATMVAERSFDPGGPMLVALVDGFVGNSWASGYPASVAAGSAVVLSDGSSLPASTVEFLDARSSDPPSVDLFCAPEVAHDACAEADDLLSSLG